MSNNTIQKWNFYCVYSLLICRQVFVELFLELYKKILEIFGKFNFLEFYIKKSWIQRINKQITFI